MFRSRATSPSRKATPFNTLNVLLGLSRLPGFSGCHYLDIKGTYEGCCSQLRSPRTRNYMLGMALWAGARLGVEPVGWLIDQVNIF
jgi:hypothetical protein